jgi:hypothetical protein
MAVLIGEAPPQGNERRTQSGNIRAHGVIGRERS